MKYSLRSLMIAALVGPPLLAGLYFWWRPFFASSTTGILLAWLLYIAIFVAPMLLAFRRHL